MIQKTSFLKTSLCGRLHKQLVGYHAWIRITSNQFFRAAFTTSSLDRVVTAIDSARIQRGTRKISYSVDRIRDRAQCPGL